LQVAVIENPTKGPQEIFLAKQVLF